MSREAGDQGGFPDPGSTALERQQPLGARGQATHPDFGDARCSAGRSAPVRDGAFRGGRRLLSDPAGRSALRVLFETSLLALCNDLRQAYGEARQDLPASVLETMDVFVEENMYDAATGAARKVRYGPTMVSLTDFTVAVGRAPDCLACTVHEPVHTTIWGSDGYRYEVRLGSPGSRDSAIRFRMGHPDDLNWRVLPVDLSLQPRRTIAGATCRDFPTIALGAGAIIDQCRLEPNDDVVFRVLPLVLRDVTVNGVSTACPRPVQRNSRSPQRASAPTAVASAIGAMGRSTRCQCCRPVWASSRSEEATPALRSRRLHGPFN
jgi:hypothetical protein